VWSKPFSTGPARRRLVVAAGLVLAVCGATAGCGGDAKPSPRMPASSGQSEQRPARPSSPRPQPVHEPVALSPQFADPTVVSVPALDISARLRPLHLDAKGRLAPPKYGLAGWYAAGPEPGEPGAAVIAGHLDSKVGPDVFFRLGQARPGQRVRVGLEDGTTLAFRITQVQQFSQSDFPTKRVYRATREPKLRLITCGGDYDHAAGHYKNNLVVFADLAT
jgi:hypothetical protein